MLASLDDNLMTVSIYHRSTAAMPWSARRAQTSASPCDTTNINVNRDRQSHPDSHGVLEATWRPTRLAAQAPLVSRGDRSDTPVAEVNPGKDAGIQSGMKPRA